MAITRQWVGGNDAVLVAGAVVGGVTAAVEMVPAGRADDAALVDTLCEVVNRAYALAEAGIWRDQYARTSPTDMAAAIRGEQVVVAHLDDRLVGSICTRALDGGTGWLGALAVDPQYGGRGIGRELVAFAERCAAAAGLTTMQLELLVPNEHASTHSQLLTAWYERLGYREVRRRALADVEPGALPFLATPCDIAVYHKMLGRHST